MADSSKPSAPRRRGPGRPFAPGQSGNPGGKSSDREELRRYLRETFGRSSIDGIAAMAGLIPGKRGAKSEKVKLDAYRWCADQAIGKAVQAISNPDGSPIRLDLSQLSTDQLQQLESIRGALKVKP